MQIWSLRQKHVRLMRNIERKHDTSHVNRFLVEVEPDKINNDESRYHSSAKLMIDNVRALI